MTFAELANNFDRRDYLDAGRVRSLDKKQVISQFDKDGLAADKVSVDANLDYKDCMAKLPKYDDRTFAAENRKCEARREQAVAAVASIKKNADVFTAGADQDLQERLKIALYEEARREAAAITNEASESFASCRAGLPSHTDKSYRDEYNKCVALMRAAQKELGNIEATYRLNGTDDPESKLRSNPLPSISLDGVTRGAKEASWNFWTYIRSMDELARAIMIILLTLFVASVLAKLTMGKKVSLNWAIIFFLLLAMTIALTEGFKSPAGANWRAYRVAASEARQPERYRKASTGAGREVDFVRRTIRFNNTHRDNMWVNTGVQITRRQTLVITDFKVRIPGSDLGVCKTILGCPDPENGPLYRDDVRRLALMMFVGGKECEADPAACLEFTIKQDETPLDNPKVFSTRDNPKPIHFGVNNSVAMGQLDGEMTFEIR
jgi:hypothetical protein